MSPASSPDAAEAESGITPQTHHPGILGTRILGTQYLIICPKKLKKLEKTGVRVKLEQ
ncbi:MAG: hypothetical protein GY820_20485 [Gammaproteobacteria bacterium]|nr:hypothetical protein [Gammaproteobacteria bacterium]